MFKNKVGKCLDGILLTYWTPIGQGFVDRRRRIHVLGRESIFHGDCGDELEKHFFVNYCCFKMIDYLQVDCHMLYSPEAEAQIWGEVCNLW